MFDLERFRMTFETMLRLYFTKTIETSNNQEKYEALSHTIMSMLADDWEGSVRAIQILSQSETPGLC